MKSLENCIESQTVVSDIAAVRVPVDVVYGMLDAFIAAGSMTVIERMRHVTMHRVDANDHLIRPRLARALARVIDVDSESVAVARLGVWTHESSEEPAEPSP